MGDYRRHDALEQDRQKEILSPYAKAGLGSVCALLFLGYATRGIWGLAGAAGTAGIIATSAPAWTRNSFIERHESSWIVRRLERYHQAEKRKADEEAKLKASYENPTRLDMVAREAGCLVFILLALAAIALGIAGVPGNDLAGHVGLAVGLMAVYPTLHRFSKLRRLQSLADEPRGGVKTVTLRDFAVCMESWPDRYPLFLISSLLAAVAAIMLALSTAETASAVSRLVAAVGTTAALRLPAEWFPPCEQ